MADIFYNPYIVVKSDASISLVAGELKTLYLNLGEVDIVTNSVFFTMSQKDAHLPIDAWTKVVNRACTVSDAVNGIAFITLSSSETAIPGDYRCQVFLATTTGTPIQTIYMFNAEILASLAF